MMGTSLISNVGILEQEITFIIRKTDRRPLASRLEIVVLEVRMRSGGGSVDAGRYSMQSTFNLSASLLRSAEVRHLTRNHY